VGLGLALYDLLAAGAGWPRHRGVRAGLAGMPAVDRRRFPWGAVYSDAQLLFPERFTVELLVDARRIAAALGSRFEVCTHRQVLVGGDGTVAIGPAAVGGAAAGGGAFDVRADAVVNATGAWVDRTLEAVLPAAAGRRLIGGTKGSHLLLHSPPLRAALADHGVYGEAADGRPVFVLPFGSELVLVGTTDIPFSGDPAAARAEDAEIDYLLAATARIFPAVGVGHADVQQHYCGVRPLPFVGGEGGAPAGITRRHLLVRHRESRLPVWSVVGGKLTTCRSLAETTAATVLGTLGVPVRGTSRERPLPGACAGASRIAAVHACRDLAAGAGMSRAEAEQAAEHAVGLFGARAAEVWRAGGAARRGLICGIGLPVAAVECCVREEWAATLDDLIERRLMLAMHERLSREAIRDVAEAFSAVGGLPSARVPAAVEACVTRLFDRYGRRVPHAAAEGVAAHGSMERNQR
ncbi:MAG: FAD-dependent oxidoreductase, partial [Planctomycetia bacterium]